MNLMLKRYSYTNKATLGRLFYINDEGKEVFLLFTLELPWKSNLPFESCIPIGLYHLEEYYSEKRQSTVFRLHGGSVYKDKEEMILHNGVRYQIQIHIGNTINDVVGCIVVGSRLSTFPTDRFAVIDSRTGFELLLRKYKQEKFPAINIVDEVFTI